jgi:hypothetical protein
MFRHKNAMRNELTGDEIRLVDFFIGRIHHSINDPRYTEISADREGSFVNTIF